MQTAILKLSIRYVFVLIVVFSTFLRYFIHKKLYFYIIYKRNSKKVLLNKNIVLILHGI